VRRLLPAEPCQPHASFFRSHSMPQQA
jgi:hypothetical protein